MLFRSGLKGFLDGWEQISDFLAFFLIFPNSLLDFFRKCQFWACEFKLFKLSEFATIILWYCICSAFPISLFPLDFIVSPLNFFMIMINNIHIWQLFISYLLSRIHMLIRPRRPKKMKKMIYVFLRMALKCREGEEHFSSNNFAFLLKNTLLHGDCLMKWQGGGTTCLKGFV